MRDRLIQTDTRCNRSVLLTICFRWWWSLLLAVGLAACTAEPLPQATWQTLPEMPPHPFRYEDLFFVSPSVGWVVNRLGEIDKTEDGGRTWIRQLEARLPSGDPVRFRSVGFANAQVGWAGTLSEGSLLYETRDGGATWTDITARIDGPLPGGVCGLFVVNEQVAYGAGRYTGPAHLLKTTDGGASWTATDMSTYAGTLVDAFFFDERHGLAVGGTTAELHNSHAVVLATTDGGATWTTRHTTNDLGEWGWKISFPTRRTGYISVESTWHAKVLKTTDGGQTWAEIVLDEGANLQGIGFMTKDLGWISGHGKTFTTRDGGRTWQAVSFGAHINRFRWITETLGYAAGRELYKYSTFSSNQTR